ncbi:MAG: AAA family ATPase [Pseudomonadota bacterium]
MDREEHAREDGLSTLAVANYRSLRELIAPLGGLNVVCGPNGSGKSNLYRALRLLAAAASDGPVAPLAREGGLSSVLWAGPETVGARMRRGEVPVQGQPRQHVVRLRLGFGGEDFGYAIGLGLPESTPQVVLADGSRRTSHFGRDPLIKHECIWAGPAWRPASTLLERRGPMVRVRRGREWHVVTQHMSGFDSVLTHLADPDQAPEVLTLRERMRAWRFYDHLRTDADAPARQPQVGTRTTALDDEGRHLAAALETIREIGDVAALDDAIDYAFPGAAVDVQASEAGWLSVRLNQPGLLRPLDASELSDGTLRYLLLVAALLTPRPPPLMVLNEPETSLHPDLLPALARLITTASARTQVWVVSHASRLIAALEAAPHCQTLQLERELGETAVCGQSMLDQPTWRWPEGRK